MSSPDMAWQPWMFGKRRGMEAADRVTHQRRRGRQSGRHPQLPAETSKEETSKVAQQHDVPSDCWRSNKRVCHRSMEAAGIRDGMRATADLNALGFHQRSSRST